MSTRPNRKVVKYKREYLITIEGKTDTNLPNDPPLGLTTAENMITNVVYVLDDHFKSRSVTIEKINGN